MNRATAAPVVPEAAVAADAADRTRLRDGIAASVSCLLSIVPLASIVSSHTRSCPAEKCVTCVQYIVLSHMRSSP